ncbi:hypothetical protein GOP47_0005296 [Adiantum capillus-veneris]|uniref:Exostosin GT47 domain-containing protein n=1 Tax=Adiantum capillus-veneris TaxID=13818 RepID=A0A9D4V5K0_ADICA|nr:hypothetical protein GOP47_0005296 [Adiantum capillus-veneris]
MDWIKATGGGSWWPIWRQQAKKAVVAMAIILAAGLLFVELKKDSGFKDPIINTELQRDYRGSGGAWQDDPEMLKDYSYNARVYDRNNADNLQGAELSTDNLTKLNESYADNHLSNAGDTDLQHAQGGTIDDRDAQTRERAESGDGGPHNKLPTKVAEGGSSLGAMNGSTTALVKNAQHGGNNHEMREHGAPNDLNEMVGSSLPPSSPSSSSTLSKKGDDNDHRSSKKAAVTAPIPAPTIFSSNAEAVIEEKHNETRGFSTKGVHVDSKEDSVSNQTKAHSLKGKRKPQLWPYSRLELQLYAAKIAIENAPLSNTSSNIVLHAPIYHNLSQFIRSYELMEKLFRVYIYKEGRKPLVHTGPVTGIYSSEGLFIRQMEKNTQFRTNSVEEALAVFLPYSVANMVDELYEPPSTSMLPLSTFIKDYVNEVAARHPFWNRTRGGDHFFISCHDWGLMTTFEHAELRHNAIKILCNADATTEFKTGRDASLPEFYMHATEKLDGGMEDEKGLRRQPPHQRNILAFFAGQMHGRVRPKLLQYWEYPKGGKEMQIFGVLPDAEARRMSYTNRMHSSRYCICPMGYEVNSPRLVEAIQALCVPVIIADGFVLPFSHVLDWASFSVTVAEKDLPSLKSILQGISEHAYMIMQERLQYVRQHFRWHETPRPFDTFHMILHSVWTSRLTNITSV